VKWSDIPFDPSLKTLRQFAGLLLVFFGAWGLHQALIRRHTTIGLIMGFAALAIGLLGLIRPQAIRPIFVGWMVVAFPIGWTVSQLMLALMFFGLFTPIGLVFRILGRDPLKRARRSEQETYWTPKPAAADLRRYFKQF
jgi:Saxitoxin biosynthesis operon protein SxtJ